MYNIIEQRYYNQYLNNEPWRSSFYEYHCYDEAFQMLSGYPYTIKKPLQCHICLEDFNKNIPQSILSCGHRYCRKCINRHEHYRWIDGRDDHESFSRCPDCNNEYHLIRNKYNFKYNLYIGFWSKSCLSLRYALYWYIEWWFLIRYKSNKLNNHQMYYQVNFMK